MYDLFVLALNCSDCYNAYDIVCGASTGQIVDRSCDTLGNRAVCFCLCQSLNQLIADISSIKASPTLGTIAASSCISPSSLRSGFCSLAIFVASTTLSTSACFALPFVEWERNATFGSAPTRERKDSAEDAAIAAIEEVLRAQKIIA